MLLISAMAYGQLDIKKRNVTVTENFHVRDDTVPNMTEVIKAITEGNDTINVGIYQIISDTDSIWVEESGTWYCSIKQFEEGGTVSSLSHTSASGSAAIDLYDGSYNSSVTKIVSRSQFDSIYVTVNSLYNGGVETTGNEVKIGDKNDVIVRVLSSDSDGDGEVTVTGKLYIDEQFIKVHQYSGSLTDGSPTASEITTITGFGPLQGAGTQVTIKDTDGTGLLYKIESDGTSWYYTVMTAAL